MKRRDSADAFVPEATAAAALDDDVAEQLGEHFVERAIAGENPKELEDRDSDPTQLDVGTIEETTEADLFEMEDALTLDRRHGGSRRAVGRRTTDGKTPH